MIAVGIVEDNVVYADALTLFLKKADDVSVVFSGAHLSELPALIEAAPDVVIMDINLGEESGIDAVCAIKKALSDTQVFMLTVFEEEEKIFQSLQAGAIGYLLKKDPPQKILEAIRAAHKGESVMNGQVARKILTYFQKPARQALDIEAYRLTKREKEILQYLIEGLSYKEIAAACFVSIDTINSHIRKIYTKLNVRSRAEISARFR
jgi:DNA-binding NarL/FixJ family response regulator